MRFVIEGVGPHLAPALERELVAAGHEPGDPPQLAVIGIDAPTGDDLIGVEQAAWQETVAALRTAFAAVRHAAAAMTEAGDGRILVLVPVHAQRPSRACGLAAVVGSFMTTVAQVAAVELAPSGIRVNVVAVGPVAGSDPDAVVDGIPIGRLLRPEEIGQACCLLASEAARAVNGAVLVVDGGYAVTKALGGSPYARSG
ncbi:MAG: SDR family oxidoreductase [Gaiella sp.]